MLSYQQKILTLVDNALNDEGKCIANRIPFQKATKKIGNKNYIWILTTEGFEPSLFRTGRFLSKA